MGHGSVPLEPEAFERTQDLAGGARLLARRVQILDGHLPASARRARIEPAGERGDQRAEGQRAGGGWGETGGIHGWLEETARLFSERPRWARRSSPTRSV